ncbi:type II/IV secretion system protein TadC [Vibrio navarrensis]|uniref:Type II secretion system F family protein n=1 Tax=Vibrio navarrensis TaxID=29495 RepID=A0AAJ4IDH3_9VIBR|nr:MULTISPECIES: type II secretion system F family protein [Vibrio]KJR24904.1 type II/IV secretion system protein TadC [Vibrio sp. S234-5]MBE3651103.1 type II/IV secretion system protein TadC [Vibrio navarrensis]MBE3655442.1 type II/IV secretion system protein TadC [Vibrio navarrensis]MBE3659512.1 type II/IV secretion system protein TadC [Vibrio navarrensis]MBE4602303.1 type II/IV secretion system protein TadC [Vibrio navarrensis]
MELAQFLTLFSVWMMLVMAMLIWKNSRQRRRQEARLALYVKRKSLNTERSHIAMHNWITQSEKARLSRLLANAGFHKPQALTWLLLAKVACGLLVALMLLIRQVLNEEAIWSLWSLTFVLVGYVFGANGPEWWLNLNADRYRKKLKQSAPDAIDLLVLCVESGLSLNRAFERVARYLHTQHVQMSEQFRITSAELDLLNDRTQALNNLSWRTGIPELHTLATTLTMAEKYGSPLADTLRQISEDARRQRSLDIEEKAGKLPGKITLIQMTMIMLPMLVMVISPILSQLLTSLA